MATKPKIEAQNPLILRCHRLVEAFGKSDDERNFYLDRLEGFIVYVDLDKLQNEQDALEAELKRSSDRYCLIPKLTFYETKKFMEGFVNEKIYDIDTKEKLLDIIQSKEARENFLEFLCDHHSELEKWQQYYQERSRIRIIEWLRNNNFHFVFEEDLEMNKNLLEKLKQELFQTKVNKEIQTARKVLFAKAKTYYSNEALNPRPKRGRPPKQSLKLEVEPQVAIDVYTTVHQAVNPFLFIPDISNPAGFTFSSKYETEGDFLAHRKGQSHSDISTSIESINQKLSALRSLSTRWSDTESIAEEKMVLHSNKGFDEEEEDDELEGIEELSFAGSETRIFSEEKAKKRTSQKQTNLSPKALSKKSTSLQNKPKRSIMQSESSTKAAAIKSKMPKKPMKASPKRIMPQPKSNKKEVY